MQLMIFYVDDDDDDDDDDAATGGPEWRRVWATSLSSHAAGDSCTCFSI